MISRTITVRIPARVVRRRFAQIPAILAGKAPDPHGLRRYFFAILARSLYRKIHTAYKVKSEGGTDSLGNTWRGLKKSTKRRRLAPSTVEEYPLSARLFINRVSDLLLDSFAPGKIAGVDYLPSPNQLYELTRDGLTLGSEVQYAKYVHKKRRLWPAKMRPWIKASVNYALGQTMQLLALKLSEER